MKKITWLVVCLVMGAFLVSAAPADAGDYDGLWYTPVMPGQFFMIRNSDTIILGVGLDLVGGSELFVGTLNGNTGTATDLQEGYDATLNFQFSSSTSCTVTLTSCEGDCSSAPPPNVPIPMDKIF